MGTKKLCSESDCFEKVDSDEMVKMADGTFHPLSLKCWDCRTDEDRKKLKNYRKSRRKAENKKLRKLKFV
jgi:hypothetical protein